MVAGKTGTAVAYIVLARDIVRGICAQLGAHDVEMLQEIGSFAGDTLDTEKSLLTKSLEGRCYSGLHHEDDLDGGILHYFGCLKFGQRRGYFDSLPDGSPLKIGILKEQARISRLRDVFRMEGSATVNGLLYQDFKNCQSQRFPRRRIDTEQTTPISGPPIDVLGKNLLLEDLFANVVYYKHARPYDHPAFENVFPNQKVPLKLLLEQSQENPLTWKCEDGMMRYFHIPANNMYWIEVSL